MSARGAIREALGLPSEDPTDEQVRAAFKHRHRLFEWHEGKLRCAICHEPATGDDIEESDR